MSRNKLLEASKEEETTPLPARGEQERIYPPTPFEAAIVSATDTYEASIRVLLNAIESNGIPFLNQSSVFQLTAHLRQVELVSGKLIQKLDPLNHRFSQNWDLSLPPSEAVIDLSEIQEAENNVSQWLHLGAANAERHLNELIRSGILLSIADFSSRSGLSVDKIEEALVLDHLFVVPVDGSKYIPCFFLIAELKSAGIEKVSKVLAPLRGESRLEFFMTGKASLSGLSPLDALVSGDTKPVLRAAARFVRRM